VDRHRREFTSRFFSRNGKTKLVIYHNGLTSASLKINDQKFPKLKFTGNAPLQIDLSPAVNPAARQTPSNHDFLITFKTNPAPHAKANIFIVDSYTH
jgi:hypothetical protein